MDRELWGSVLRAVRRAAARVGWNGGRRRPVYPNGLIVAMYAWSVWHDRPLCSACRRGSYGAFIQPADLDVVTTPSPDSQRNRRTLHPWHSRR